ncbi:hypothetical protein [Polaromonas sp. JS666]|uniref:hypothetical protein n=1 Tax=Polaromonas sp. (strain JS666 / ATCC BAA-500) TaxID=296591 RepID=UPI00088D2BF7|nr:hypothetical protein [Polaromonas sp. JS666]SDM53842.1 hypothetical protein SAMN05720382_101693 [Polaromonas sp. JS666]
MHTFRTSSHFHKLLLVLTAAYFLTSLGHFSHNAEFICEYPNLPAWLTRAQVYAVWAAITSVGALGLLLMRRRFMATGLLLVAVYAAMGFDGLGHYAVAPIALHPLMANVTILSEVAAASLLLPVALWLLASHMLRNKVRIQQP